jgi:glutamate/tyrosine decarboxylase-like PLP-dependent enzyme
LNSYASYLPLFEKLVKELDAWRESFGAEEQSKSGHLEPEKIAQAAEKLADRLRGNYPFHHPQYAGQMLKPPHPAAWLAYALTMTINPNNHALDGGPPTSEMEKDVVKQLASMIGFSDNHLGHLTSGGTIANLEALFIAREIHPGKAIAASANAHYTHKRMCHLLKSDFIEIPVDRFGKPDLNFLKENASKIGTVVVTMGTTGLGYSEPLSDVLNFTKQHNIRVHADAAYGGFFKLISDELPSARHWARLHECDSVVIDPHKHGLQPYGCGSVLYKDATVGTYFKHDSPYTYFTSDELHLGEISIECSRAGAAAAALWTTLQLLPLTEDGLGAILSGTRKATLTLAERITNEPGWQVITKPQLDILGYFKEPETKKISDLNRINKQIFQIGMENQEGGFHLSLFKLDAKQFVTIFPDYEPDAPQAVILRSVLMKEEHAVFVDKLANRLFKTAKNVD